MYYVLYIEGIILVCKGDHIFVKWMMFYKLDNVFVKWIMVLKSARVLGNVFKYRVNNNAYCNNYQLTFTDTVFVTDKFYYVFLYLTLITIRQITSNCPDYDY